MARASVHMVAELTLLLLLAWSLAALVKEDEICLVWKFLCVRVTYSFQSFGVQHLAVDLAILRYLDFVCTKLWIPITMILYYEKWRQLHFLATVGTFMLTEQLCIRIPPALKTTKTFHKTIKRELVYHKSNRKQKTFPRLNFSFRPLATLHQSNVDLGCSLFFILRYSTYHN